MIEFFNSAQVMINIYRCIDDDIEEYIDHVGQPVQTTDYLRLSLDRFILGEYHHLMYFRLFISEYNFDESLGFLIFWVF
jgi:hypothetical protein